VYGGNWKQDKFATMPTMHIAAMQKVLNEFVRFDKAHKEQDTK
jgi:hypothetical protein